MNKADIYNCSVVYDPDIIHCDWCESEGVWRCGMLLCEACFNDLVNWYNT